MPRRISSATTLDNLRKEARRWLKAWRAGDTDAHARYLAARPDRRAEEPSLRDVQHALARDYGYESWIALKSASSARPADADAATWRSYTEAEYDALAANLVRAINDEDEAALVKLNAHHQTSLTLDDVRALVWSRVYAFRQRAFSVARNYIELDEARLLVAQNVGFGSWDALVSALKTGARPVPAYVIEMEQGSIAPRRLLSRFEWDEIFDVIKERRLTCLRGAGALTDALLGRVSELEHVTALNLAGARQLTDAGLRQLARMPQLKLLCLSDTTITDTGLEVLRELPNLQTFEMTWHGGVTDSGTAHLRFCERLERVDLMGSMVGDGTIAALQGKAALHDFSAGRLVTDRGLELLHNLPLMKAPGTARLLIDGPFTDRGLASLAGLEGIAELDLFWHATAITPDGFAHLSRLPNLTALGADRELSGDRAMAHIAALPRLTKLRAQESAATDAGFEALGRSKTLQEFWGRRCPHFGTRGFVALSKLPDLRSLGIGCGRVADDALARLPDFPALSALTPIDFQDEGFRHVGRCERLERLSCMYCRDTTDASTEHIAGLRLRYYYAGLTKIADRTLEILGAMPSLEEVEFYECKGVTNAGLVHLTALPHLRRVALYGLPGVTFDGTRVFPETVGVRHST